MLGAVLWGLAVAAHVATAALDLVSTPYYVPMSDGTELYAIVTQVRKHAGQPQMVYFQTVPYNYEWMGPAVTQGWESLLPSHTVLVYQQQRGTENSTGEFQIWKHAQSDAADTVRWIRAQPWCNGNIMPYGASAMGMNALFAMATDENTTFPAATVQIATPSVYEAGYRSSAYRSIVVDGITMYTNMSELASEVYEHETFSDWWRDREVTDFSSVAYPVTMKAGWFDIFQKPNLDVFEQLRTEGHASVAHDHRLIIDPLGHCTNPDAWGINKKAMNAIFATNAVVVLSLMETHKNAVTATQRAIALEEYRLLVRHIPQIVWYVFTEDGGYLTGADNFPAPTYVDQYLRAGGKLVADADPSMAGATAYDYDPAHWVKTLGGYNFFEAKPGPNGTWDVDYVTCGPQDLSQRAPRTDIVTFTTTPLTEPMAVTGHITAHLEIMSNATDTDFIATLVDVFPNGTRMFVTDGIVRMRLQHRTEYSPPMQDGVVYAIEVDMWSTSRIFGKGHMIALEISSSSYPAYDANQNVHPHVQSANASSAIAHNTVLTEHSATPSKVTLPVVPVSALAPWHLWYNAATMGPDMALAAAMHASAALAQLNSGDGTLML